MREIKFRAWHKSMKKMFPLKGMNFARQVVVLWGGEDLEHVPMTEVHVMQFTGKKDIQGREIFELDQVEAKSTQGTIKGSIVFDGEKSAFGILSNNTKEFSPLNQFAELNLLGHCCQ